MAPEDKVHSWSDSTRPSGCLFIFFNLYFVHMNSPEEGIAHREKASQELLVTMPLGGINSLSSFFSVPWQFLWTQTTYFYNCFSLKSLKLENRRADGTDITAEGSHFFALSESSETGTEDQPSQTWSSQCGGRRGSPPDSLSSLLPSSFLSFPPSLFLPYFLPPFYSSPFLSFMYFKFFLNTTCVAGNTSMLKTKKLVRTPVLEEYTC